MKRLGLFMTVIMILCITVNAQKQSNRTLVAYFSATGTTEKSRQTDSGGDRRSPLRNTTCKEIYLRRPGLGTTNPRAAVWNADARHVPHCVPSPKTWQPMIPSISVSPFGGTWLQESSTVFIEKR